MLMPSPQRDDDGVAFLPVERLAVDDCRATVADGLVDAGAGVTVGFRLFVAVEHLKPSRHGRQGRADLVGILHERTSIALYLG